MNGYNLGFIYDEKIFHHILDTVKKYRFSINLKEFNKNLIDPIKLTFDSKIYGKELSAIVENEVLRQIDKSNTNHIGYFHQNIFNHFGDGWEVLSNGYDIINKQKHIFVEMKNKHNTMNSSSSQKTYMRMQNTILKDNEATCMLVEVIARNSQNIKWNVSLDGNSVSDDRIRRVSIDKFYEIVTGDKFAFQRLCEKLPCIISDAVNSINSSNMQNTVFSELEAISPNFIKSLYLLSFERYEGFHNLEITE